MSVIDEIKKYVITKRQILSIILILYASVIFFMLFTSDIPFATNILFLIIALLYLSASFGVFTNRLWGFSLSIILPIIVIFIALFRIFEVFYQSRALDEGAFIFFLLFNILILTFSLHVSSKSYRKKEFFESKSYSKKVISKRY